MKSFQTQTHYEVLEISVGATAAEVRGAYERLSSLYAEDQVVLYGLIDSSRADALRERLKVAYEVLADDQRREAYDLKIGLPPRVPPPRALPLPHPPAANVPTPRSSAGSGWSNFSWVTPAAPPPPAPSQPTLFTYSVPARSVAATEAPPPPPSPPIEEPAQSPAAPVDAPAATAEEEEIPVELGDWDVEVEAQPPAEMTDQDVQVAIVPSRALPPREFRAPPALRPYEVPEGVEINGDLLKQVRLARGLSLTQVADRTRISVKHLENIEGDRYDALPAGVYLRGMLMSLARELGLDGLRVSRSYLTFVEAHRSKG